MQRHKSWDKPAHAFKAGDRVQVHHRIFGNYEGVVIEARQFESWIKVAFGQYQQGMRIHCGEAVSAID